ncbi:E3 ubiquitin-protein ligase RHA2A-like [Durio zibethinus]|uniref:E3 ubiquitin-protein ligase RHA2A-like n=1 Tax=Durio zibethinus TaxID=66656 RepID=A0A6P6A3Q2_DURZI|nr:E3 ubiquitin-protein ligase RHA2A-like [Durio zibethinus]
MIQPFNSIKFSQLLVIALLLHLLTHLKFILMAKDFCWCQVQKLPKLFQEHGSSYQNHLQDYAEADNDERPSPSLVPVPFMSHVVSNLIKTKLPVVQFSRSKLQSIGEQSAVCSICLACVKGSEEIRELANCSHLYHKECVDGWVDQGHGTCPLCRLKLLPCQADDEDANGEKDPWRSERIAYLFGEDYLFDTL